MSDKPKNALAELAERLKFDVDELNGKHKDHIGISQSVTEDVSNALCIVEELAKVEWFIGVHDIPFPSMSDTMKCMRICREIAEEGAGDGK